MPFIERPDLFSFFLFFLATLNYISLFQDVTEEGLLYMKTVNKPPPEDSLQDNIQAIDS